jgi:hypothetical protein
VLTAALAAAMPFAVLLVGSAIGFLIYERPPWRW